MRLIGGLAYVSAEEMAAIDDAAIGTYRIDVLSLMENAGAAVAVLAARMLGGSAAGRRVACLTGKGNNGGDGLVAARHLNNRGADVTVVLAQLPEELGGVASRQFESVKAMGTPVATAPTDLSGYDLLLDALLGYNARGPPREPIAGIIRLANESNVPILAVDLPSGLDPTLGAPHDPCVVATATLTLGLPKTGFLNPTSRRFVGELYLADVSIPWEALPEPRPPAPKFEEQILRIA